MLFLIFFNMDLT